MQRRLQIGEQIGEYRIIQFLGAGGMGEVYRGEHAKLGRSAAIKVLLSSIASESFRHRFFNEARLQANLHHPHVAALYDFQEIGGQLCIFMEYVDGDNLEDLIKRRAFTVEDALKTFQSICEAVAYIHANNIVHRDIKSQNVKLSAGGMVKMLDFGIAKSKESHNLTQVGGVIGTPHYLAPEQLSGEKASPQTDVWALGILLYEMLTGKLPFEADTMASLCYQITMAEFPPPQTLNPAVSENVAKIVRRCLEKNPAERYQSANEILEDVRRALNGEKNLSSVSRKASGFFNNGEAKTKIQNSSYQNNSFPVQSPSGNYVSNDYANSDAPVETSKAPKKLPIALIAGFSAAAVVGLFIVAGIVIWAMSGRNSPLSPISNQAILVNNGQLKRIKIDVDEGKAQVLRNGASVGLTPYDLEARDGEKVALILRRDGFHDKPIELEIKGSKQVYTFSLKPR